MEVNLTIHFLGGTTQFCLKEGRATVGRSDDATICINDCGLSRLHASIYCEDNKVWIIDEMSTNGIYVNGEQVSASGKPLASGDKISIGDNTIIWVNINNPNADAVAAAPFSMAGLPRTAFYVPIIIALVVAVAFGARWISSQAASKQTGKTQINANEFEARTKKQSQTVLNSNSNSSQSEIPDPPAIEPATALNKLYKDMTPQERMDYVTVEAKRISEVVGTRPCNFTQEVLKMIKANVDGYSSRISRSAGARFGSGDLRALMERARRYAPLIIRSFKQENVKPEIGLYIVMIESEYFECLTSPVGAKGMFQFMPATARGYGVDPEARCDLKKMAPAGAKYIRDRLNEFGTDATSVGLAIAGYNRSPDSVRRDLHDVLNDNGERKERSFWTLVANSKKLDHWFQENMRYVPKFYAAAIIGENPQRFGLSMRQLSTYTDETEQR